MYVRNPLMRRKKERKKKEKEETEGARINAYVHRTRRWGGWEEGTVFFWHEIERNPSSSVSCDREGAILNFGNVQI